MKIESIESGISMLTSLNCDGIVKMEDGKRMLDEIEQMHSKLTNLVSINDLMLDEIAYDNIDEKTDWLDTVFDNLETTHRKLY